MASVSRRALAENLSRLMKRDLLTEMELSRRSGVSQKAINNTLHMRNSTQIETAEALARPFGLSGWQILVPAFDIDSALELSSLVSYWQKASTEDRQYLYSVAEREAK